MTENGRRRRRLWILLRAVFALLGVAFMAVTFLDSWRDVDARVIPTLPFLGGSLLLLGIGLALAAKGWVCLLEAPTRVAVIRSFFVSQLGKYIPGGVWQMLGQVGLAADAGVHLGRAAVAFPIHALVQAAAGATVGLVLLVDPMSLPRVLRWSVFAGLLLMVPLYRPSMAWVLGRLPGRLRIPGAGALPEQWSIVRAFGWTLLSVVAFGGAFALLLASARPDRVGQAVPAFAFAWTVGFLAVPFPAGLGVREAVLLGALRGVEAAPIIAAAGLFRLGTIVMEGLMIGLSTLASGARVPLNGREE